MRSRALALTVFALFGAASIAAAQAPQGGGGRAAGAPAAGARAEGGRAEGARAGGGPARRPPLFFREEWKQNEKNDEHPITQASVANANLELKTYGPNAAEMAITGKAGDENNPIHVWTGLCTGPCAVGMWKMPDERATQTLGTASVSKISMVCARAQVLGRS